MGSKHPSSNGPDVTDTTSALHAFEQQNSVRIVTTLRSCSGNGVEDIWLEGKALSGRDTDGVRSLLASASVKCSGSRHKSLDAAFLALLYALDFQLAESEWQKTERKS